MIFTDQLNRAIRLENYPKRIVSLVPSQTELLHYLGLENEVVGITKFCIHPNEWFKTKQRVGGTKNINLELIDELKPHLIIANKEENEQRQIELLSKKYPTYISNIYNLNDALAMIKDVSIITNKKNEGEQLVIQIQENFNELFPVQKNKSCAYLIWRNPYMVCGTDTFVNDMLSRIGLVNVFEGRYPEINLEELQNKNPNVVLLSSEPYPFKEIHIKELQEHLPNSNVLLVDGEMFSWYGSRLVNAPEYFYELKKLID